MVTWWEAATPHRDARAPYFFFFLVAFFFAIEDLTSLRWRFHCASRCPSLLLLFLGRLLLLHELTPLLESTQ
jgi:hypothetical protein